MSKSRFIMIAVLILAAAVGVSADVIVKQSSTANSMGMMQMDVKSTEYVKSDRSATERVTAMAGGMAAMFGGEGTEMKEVTITRLDKAVSWNLDQDKKSYSEIPLASYKTAMEQMDQQDDDDDDTMEDADKFEWTIDVKKEDGPVDINGFKCKGIVSEATGVNKEDPANKINLLYEYWYSEKVKGYDELMQFYVNFAKATGVDAMMSQKEVGKMFSKYGDQFSEMVEEMREAKGYPIKTVITIKGVGGDIPSPGGDEMDESQLPPGMMDMMKGMMGGQEQSADGMTTLFSVTNVVESIEKKAVDDAAFEIPEGYSKSN